ncbi:MAG: peptidylprolyl isomerase, partial [Parcubacteria group bacterium]
GYLQGMADINKKAQSDIQNATDAENSRLKDTLNNNETNMDLIKQYSQAIITTNLGKIQVKFYNADAPVTVNNFLKLASEKFYDGTKFHRVIKGFMIQGGDPNSKTVNTSSWGMGGPGYEFNDELKGTEKYPQGTLAMANSGPNTNGSQFFIVTASPAAPLPPSYTVFGTVILGMDVALKIENVKTVSPGQVDRPVEDVVIQSVEPIK